MCASGIRLRPRLVSEPKDPALVGRLAWHVILGETSAAWMWVFWHGGFPLLVAAAVLMRDRSLGAPLCGFDTRAWILALIGIPAALAVALGVFAVRASLSAPFHSAAETVALTTNPTAFVVCSLDAIAIVLVLLKGRLRALLDLWIAVAPRYAMR
jgi:Membrane-associated sensor, integral membrane domain